MDTKLKRAVDILRNEGAVSLYDKSTSFVRERYARQRGVMKLKEGPVSARFAYETERQRGLLSYFDDTERAVLRDFITELRPDDVVLDVGANYGVYSIFAAPIVDRVIAVEPFPPNLSVLRRNLTLNQADVQILQVALSNEAGEAEFIDTGEELDGSVGIATENDTETVSVETALGDTLVRQGDIPQPTVIKIDVEGAEPLVIEGMAETLRNDSCRVVYCEIHQDSLYGHGVETYRRTPEEVETELSAMGFDLIRTKEIAGTRIVKYKNNIPENNS